MYFISNYFVGPYYTHSYVLEACMLKKIKRQNVSLNEGCTYSSWITTGRRPIPFVGYSKGLELTVSHCSDLASSPLGE